MTTQMLQKFIYALPIAMLLVFASCKTQHDLAYFENLPGSGTLEKTPSMLRLQPEDELQISVTSEVPQASAHFNLPVQSTIESTSTEASPMAKFHTYMVDKEGNIDFPSIGIIHVEGMTTLQLKNYLVKEISKTVKDPRVMVRLINFKVNVIGEVKEPGVVEAKTERLTLFDALAAVGDLTEYAKRDNVLVMREMPDGTIAYQRLDLHDPVITSSPFFQLQQNDVVYVTPNNVKQDNARYNQNNGYKLSVISTIVSAFSVVATLIITLTVR